MIIRIVKMTFEKDKTDNFLKVFNDSKHLIRSFDGCKHLKLLNKKDEKNVFFTYSVWESEQHLENYRHSELFKSTWAKTKILFSDKAEAWTTEALYELS